MTVASVTARWLRDDSPAWETIQQFERDIANALQSPASGIDTGYAAPAWLAAEFGRIHTAATNTARPTVLHRHEPA